MANDRHPLRHLDLKHLRQLMKIADLGSIRAAAESLAITQPALSRSVRAMEEDLGVKLVERGPRGADLTAAGNMLLKYGRIIDANLALAEKEIGGLRDHGGLLERVSIGMSWLAEVLLARRLFEFALRMDPRVRLATTVGDYEALAPRLISGKLEFLVGPPPLESSVVGVSTTVLAEFPAVVLVRAEHPLAGGSTLSFADLVAQQWILPAAGTVPRITYDNFFLAHGAAPPQPLFEVQPLSPVIRQLMLDWDLVTILPRVVAEADLAAGRFTVVPFEREIVFPMHLTRRQMGYHSPVAEQLVDEVARLCACIER